jgi:hypothetical protein
LGLKPIASSNLAASALTVGRPPGRPMVVAANSATWTAAVLSQTVYYLGGVLLLLAAGVGFAAARHDRSPRRNVACPHPDAG